MATRRNGTRAQTTASRPLAISSMIFKLSNDSHSRGQAEIFKLSNDSHSRGQAEKLPPP